MVSCTGRRRSTRRRLYTGCLCLRLDSNSLSSRARASSSLMGRLISSRFPVSVEMPVITNCSCFMGAKIRKSFEPPKLSATFLHFCAHFTTRLALVASPLDVPQIESQASCWRWRERSEAAGRAERRAVSASRVRVCACALAVRAHSLARQRFLYYSYY